MKLMVRDIQRETARYFDLPVETMWEPRGCGAGTRERSWPRQVAMCLSRRLTDHSTVRIGQFFKRDHSTIISGIRRAEHRAEAKGPMRRITRLLLADEGACL